MKRTTIFIDEELDHELHTLARHRGIPVSALMRESFARYLQEQKGGRGLALRFLGRGHSGQESIAEHHEDLLWRNLDPHGSKNPRRRRG
jgi:predicted DNA-binding protein